MLAIERAVLLQAAGVLHDRALERVLAERYLISADPAALAASATPARSERLQVVEGDAESGKSTPGEESSNAERVAAEPSA